jgi:autotransporter-associated beta strand protein
MALTLTVSQALAENLTWDGDGDGTWSGANWWDGSALTTTGGADDLLFSGRGAVGTVDVSGSVTAASGTFTANGYTFSGGTIWLNSVLGVNVAGASGTTVFNSYVRATGVQFTSAVTANQTLVFNGGGAFNGDIGANTNQTKFGTMILNSGTYAAGQYIKIGDINNPDTGVRVNTGATLQMGNAVSWIGFGQNAMINVRGGLMTAPGSLMIGRANTGRVLVDSGTFQVIGNPQLDPKLANNITSGILVGFQGTGILDIADTGVVNAHYLSVARDGTGTVNLGGGTANVYNTLYFGAGYGGTATSGSGRLNVSGGVLKIGQGGIVNAGGGTFGYEAVLSGGTVSTTGTAGWSSSVNLTLSGADGGVTFDTDQDIGLGGVLSGGGKFTKTGEGTLLLSGVNTYHGDAVISAGTLKIGDGELTLGTLTFALDGANSGLLDIDGGSVTLDGLAFDTGAATLTEGESWTLINGAFTQGAGFGISGLADQGGGIWRSAILEFDTGTGLLTVIPEPSALTLVVTGAALLALLRRRR